MKKILHHILTVIAFFFMPIVWISFKMISPMLGGSKITLLDVYGDWNDFRKSGENFGPFDKGWNE